MIKKTILIGSKAYLSTKDQQMLIRKEEQEDKTVPIEDIGLLVLEHPQVTISHRLINNLLNNKVVIISCNEQHMPNGMHAPLVGHTEHTERVYKQLEASAPLKKNLWAQTVKTKILNQGALLQLRGKAHKRMTYLAEKVLSGDQTNQEAQAAAYYWQHLFDIEDFNRQPKGMPPNNLLNYGYAILRAVVARALISSGLLPVLGIMHKNKYNAYGLADDIMEPYRPFVDLLVCQMVDNDMLANELSPEMKKELLQLPAMDVVIDEQKSPLMLAVSRTTSSLYECYSGRSRKISYPNHENFIF